MVLKARLYFSFLDAVFWSIFASMPRMGNIRHMDPKPPSSCWYMSAGSFGPQAPLNQIEGWSCKTPNSLHHALFPIVIGMVSGQNPFGQMIGYCPSVIKHERAESEQGLSTCKRGELGYSR